MSAATMELDELKQAWQALGDKLDRQHRMERLRLREERGRRMRSGLRPLVWGQALQMAAGVLLTIWGAAFWSAHAHSAHLLAFGLALHLYGIALVVCGAWVQSCVAGIDYTAPVLALQRRLAALRRAYVRGGLAVGLAWWLLWMPALAAILMSLFGVDLYRNAPSMFVYGGAVGVAGLLASAWFLRWSRDPARPRLRRAVDDGVAGASVRRAEAVLEEIERFERE
ncbi:serine/threonine protein kinase [Lysobacter yananisis]|nr:MULTISPECIES: serine/threonine protein kinase [Lysobacter]QCW25513.1 serine/threonine protein kinase [Lysobacter enzymogenes]UZW59418.1 serine/threonine protein kinase [Lysobacter enzymogenes]WMT03197.1 serine/threonine protein kinase [Lysobacter yananisis]